METYNKMLLALYRAAREMPVSEFSDLAMGMVKPLLRFDSARLVTVEMLQKGAVVHGTHLYNEPVDMVLDWEEINRLDPVLETVTCEPGRAISIHARTHYAAPRRAALLDYTQKYKHQNAMVVAEFDATRGYYDGLSLYRAAEDDQYVENERQFMEQVAPHIIEAFTVNRLVSLQSADDGAGFVERGITALARVDGMIHHCGPGFAALMRLEWPEWRGIALPDSLLKMLARVGAGGYTGTSVSVSATRIGELLLLRARKACPLGRLSRRELEVAHGYGAGRSYKEIARDMNLAPVTVRNFLQRIYLKLQIRDKAELAAILVRSDSR